MAAKVIADKCTSCGECKENCPVEAIKVEEGAKAIIDAENCTDCGACVSSCSQEAITLDE